MSRRAPDGVSSSPDQYSCWRGGAIEWADKTRYLGMTLDRWLTWSAHFDQVRKKAAQVKGVLVPLPEQKWSVSKEWCSDRHENYKSFRA
jgi:hypothetical protein